MDAAFTPEHEETGRLLREVLAERRAPGPRADGAGGAATDPVGCDEELWRTLARRLALPGLLVPASYGGAGRGPAELVAVCEEAGRSLPASPLLATAVLVAPLIAARGTEAQREALLPPIADGSLTAALAVPGGRLATALALTGANHPGDWSGGGRAGGVQATPGEDGWRLYGQADQVLDGHSAGLLLVAAHTGGFAGSRTLLFVVRGESPGVVRVRQSTLDETRPQARVELRDVAAEALGGGPAGQPPGPVDEVPRALAVTGTLAACALAAEAVGMADRALRRTVGNVRERERHGRTTGPSPAVRDRLADVYARVRSARTAAYCAALTQDPPAARLALAQSLETLRTAAAACAQADGGGVGSGTGPEREARLCLGRAASDELLFGPVHLLREHAAERAALFSATDPHSLPHPGPLPSREASPEVPREASHRAVTA
ncbi:acyl-CoA dehydrogenase family protein [Streptomyces sp. GC420]|uniref:acyl-CoA dehydrogenase family protein n=1 Tax=Streptomyces sp. GC420 TaxID=2697568 RepID=UPI001414DC10|nr:acyl-CoA dehydrogenase family protein [Streptomyces sp. GC420]NBM19001.1 acyl-CoA dehydrogenase [Streptomyces sp. GC420]